jgi:hypothetical protein
MSRHPTTAVRRLGMIAAAAVFALNLAYVVVLTLGFLSLASPEEPIGDPWFRVLELLILALMPFMLALTVAIHAAAPAGTRALSLLSVIFMSLTTALTMSVHFSILTLSLTPAFAAEPWAVRLLSFQWPSLAYAIDILAWDLFFALSVLCAAPAFGGGGDARLIRGLLILSGVLALAGLSGVVAGDMGLRNIGILGYAGVFPVAAALLVRWFRRGAAG